MYKQSNVDNLLHRFSLVLIPTSNYYLAFTSTFSSVAEYTLSEHSWTLSEHSPELEHSVACVGHHMISVDRNDSSHSRHGDGYVWVDVLCHQFRAAMKWHTGDNRFATVIDIQYTICIAHASVCSVANSPAVVFMYHLTHAILLYLAGGCVKAEASYCQTRKYRFHSNPNFWPSSSFIPLPNVTTRRTHNNSLRVMPTPDSRNDQSCAPT